jgi:hypothetical protein
LPHDEADDPVAQKRQRQNELEQELEEAFWNDRGVDIFDVDLTIYNHALEQAARELVTSSGNP